MIKKIFQMFLISALFAPLCLAERYHKANAKEFDVPHQTPDIAGAQLGIFRVNGQLKKIYVCSNPGINNKCGVMERTLMDNDPYELLSHGFLSIFTRAIQIDNEEVEVATAIFQTTFIKGILTSCSQGKKGFRMTLTIPTAANKEYKVTVVLADGNPSPPQDWCTTSGKLQKKVQTWGLRKSANKFESLGLPTLYEDVSDMECGGAVHVPGH